MRKWRVLRNRLDQLTLAGSPAYWRPRSFYQKFARQISRDSDNHQRDRADDDDDDNQDDEVDEEEDDDDDDKIGETVERGANKTAGGRILWSLSDSWGSFTKILQSIWKKWKQ